MQTARQGAEPCRAVSVSRRADPHCAVPCLISWAVSVPRRAVPGVRPPTVPARVVAGSGLSAPALCGGAAGTAASGGAVTRAPNTHTTPLRPPHLPPQCPPHRIGLPHHTGPHARTAQYRPAPALSRSTAPPAARQTTDAAADPASCLLPPPPSRRDAPPHAVHPGKRATSSDL